jgi:membrane protein DedA with SNARE-associated domain
VTPLPGVFGSVAPYLSDYGYAAVALFVLLENVGVPLPGEAILVTGAIFTVSGRLDLSVLVLVAVAAAVVGDNLGYALGRFGGRSVVVHLGRGFGVTSEHLDRVERFFSLHGRKVVVAARFLPLLRHLNGVSAGVSRMPWGRFLVANAIGAGIWVAVWTSIGTRAGAHLDAVDNVLSDSMPFVAGALVLLLLVLVARRVLRRRAPDELPVVP